MEDQRRVVSLLKKQDATLPSNRLNAKKLLNSLMKRLENNEALKQMYHDHMLNYITRAVPA
jgi:ribosome assembly protein YihI (activator of Der GTPase)